MRPLFRPLKVFSRQNFQGKFDFRIPFLIKPAKPLSYHSISSLTILNKYFFPTNTRNFEFHFLGRVKTTQFVHSLVDSDETTQFQRNPGDQTAFKLQNVLYNHRNSSEEEIEKALDRFELELTDDLVVDVVNRNRFDCKLAYIFFKWVRRQGVYSPGSIVYNEILDVLGRARRFEELVQLFDEMSERNGLLNEITYGTLLNRYSAAHKVEESIGIFNRRNEFGLSDDSVAFQSLLMWLCRYKHVEDAETLFQSKKKEFGFDIKTWNIILNGWCVLGNVHEAKRFWKDIITSNCKPDLFTCGTFINALTKKGKLGSAMKLFRSMWKTGCKPDVVTCNCVIDALCFKKRVPEALEVFREMSELGLPNVITYNTLIKHLCKIRRMEKVYELLDEMEEKKGSCLPNERTYVFLLKTLRRLEEVPEVLERMERNGCKMNDDAYNLILKMYMNWGCIERVRYTWNEMEKNGMGPDQRSYTIMIHGLYDKGKLDDALSYFYEMTSKGMVPEPRTEILVNTMSIKFKGGEPDEMGITKTNKLRR